MSMRLLAEEAEVLARSAKIRLLRLGLRDTNALVQRGAVRGRSVGLRFRLGEVSGNRRMRMLSMNRRRSARVATRVVAAGTMSWWVYAAAGCSGDADSLEPPGRSLGTLQAPYQEETKFGALSETYNDAGSAVSCTPGQTLTGCDCYSPWAACDGAYTDNDVCYAFARGNGKGVYAVARCVSFNNVSAPAQSLQSEKSGSSANSSTSTTCPAGWTLTGCSCYSPWAACEGASIVGTDTCRADNKSGGRGVYAEARCVQLGETHPSPVLGPKSGTADDAAASVSCPADHALTGCTCASTDASCDGAYAIDQECIALNRAGGSGVKPQAMCVQVAGCHNACGGPSPDGCACDLGCEQRGDCCQNYSSLCQSAGTSTVGGGVGGSGAAGG